MWTIGWTWSLLAVSEIYQQLVCFSPSMVAVLATVSGGICLCQSVLKSVRKSLMNSSLTSSMTSADLYRLIQNTATILHLILSYPLLWVKVEINTTPLLQ